MDASFLYFETKRTPMHVAGLTLYNMPEGFKGSVFRHFKKFFESRIHLIPIFHRKLARTVFELDHPGWVDSGPPDLDYHIKSAKLPKPGNQAQLESLVAEMHSELLDRKKPLWQFTIIDGLEKGPNGEKRAAMYSKVHHAAIDGGAGMVITKALYDLGPVPREVEPAEEKKPARVPTMAERAILGAHDLMTNAVTQQLKVMEAIPKAMEQAVDAAAKLAKVDPSKLTGQQLTAPKTPFAITMGKGRSYAARTVSIERAKNIAKKTGTKLNDVVMATCAGALHNYLKDKKKLPDAPLIAFVPMSIREAGNTDMNNQVSGMNVPLATEESDPIKRLRSIYDRSSERKEVASSINPLMPTDYTFVGAPHLLSGLMRLYGDTQLADVIPQAVNVCISNTMGPPSRFIARVRKSQRSIRYPLWFTVWGSTLRFRVTSTASTLASPAVAGPYQISMLCLTFSLPLLMNCMTLRRHLMQAVDKSIQDSVSRLRQYTICNLDWYHHILAVNR